jgi:hypothetical protein
MILAPQIRKVGIGLDSFFIECHSAWSEWQIENDPGSGEAE